MTDDTLHIPTMITRLELIALNRYKTMKQAAEVLGITPRTLASHMRDNNIHFNRLTKEFIIKEPHRICQKSQ